MLTDAIAVYVDSAQLCAVQLPKYLLVENATRRYRILEDFLCDVCSRGVRNLIQ